MVKAMGFLGLVVEDVETATAFYRDNLGLQVNEAESIPNQYTQFETSSGATFALLTGFEKEGIDQSFDAALVVQDVDAVYEKWSASGVEFLSEPYDMPFGRTAFVRTPDGHVLRVFRPAA
ncbi:MAG: VOC family protein [Anaerolineales bacterium]|nr:VOC family protein [Anaerolineales bacterium]MCA9931637.1 VOC family protein [Anaerolineales bacterium]